MKKRLVLVAPLLIVAAYLAAPAFAQYTMESSCTYNDSLVLDPSANGNARVCLRQTAQASCENYNFCVWRETGLQNTLAEHTASEYDGVARKVYTDSSLTVMVYQSATGPAVIAIVGPTSLYLVGAGGSRENAIYAKLAFQNLDPAFTGKHFNGIILPSVNTEDSWGASYWRNIISYTVPLIVNASYESARLHREVIGNELLVRKTSAQGRLLTFGPDDFIGEGSMGRYNPGNPDLPPLTASDIIISEETEFWVNSVTFRVIPIFEKDAGLLVHIPNQRILIAANLGKFLPDAGSIIYPNIPVKEWIETLAYMRTLGATTLITGRGKPTTGVLEVIYNRLTAQHDALLYLYSKTVNWINNGLALDDIVATVQLPTSLASSPYNAEFVSTTPGIIRAIYHDYVGWFDGKPANLESLPTVTQARRLIEFGGGEGSVLNYINKCITEHSREGALQALKMASVLRMVSPSPTVDALYVQALRFLAWTTPSAHLRNYYLTEVQKVLNPTLSISEVIPADTPQ